MWGQATPLGLCDGEDDERCAAQDCSKTVWHQGRNFGLAGEIAGQHRKVQKNAPNCFERDHQKNVMFAHIDCTLLLAVQNGREFIERRGCK